MPQRILPLSCACVLSTCSAFAQAGWVRLYPTQSPGARVAAGIAFDEVRGEALLLFGENAGGRLGDSWRFDGVAWHPVTATLPPIRDAHRMAWDGGRQRIVLFGGHGATPRTFLQDLWEWDGAQWQQRLPAVSPVGRADHAMASDRARGVLVLFGGEGFSGPLADTWEWNGSVWQERISTLHPSARSRHAMAFDPVNQRVLLYGGAYGTAWSTETWSWDGAAWSLQQPASLPPVRETPEMVADLARGRVVLFGGSTYDMFPWEWDGTDWRQLFLSSPGTRSGQAMAYDTARREVLLHGGGDALVPYQDDTWVYRTANGADARSYGAGCPGSLGAPTLATDPYGYPWLGDTVRLHAANVAPTVGAVLFAVGLAADATSLAAYGMPGCTRLVTPTAGELLGVVAGVATKVLAVPNQPVLRGAHVYVQAVSLEPDANAAGAVVSNALELVAGVR